MRKIISRASVIVVAALLAACAAKTPPAAAPAPAPAASAASAATLSAAADPKAFFAARCAGCHGADGSKGIQGKSAEFLATALSGYKAKTFGGPKKEIMEARAAQLSDADIQALAKFGASL